MTLKIRWRGRVWLPGITHCRPATLIWKWTNNHVFFFPRISELLKKWIMYDENSSLPPLRYPPTPPAPHVRQNGFQSQQMSTFHKIMLNRALCLIYMLQTHHGSTNTARLLCRIKFAYNFSSSPAPVAQRLYLLWQMRLTAKANRWNRQVIPVNKTDSLDRQVRPARWGPSDEAHQVRPAGRQVDKANHTGEQVW